MLLLNYSKSLNKKIKKIKNKYIWNKKNDIEDLIK